MSFPSLSFPSGTLGPCSGFRRSVPSHVHPEAWHVTLLGVRVFAGVIKIGLEMKSSGTRAGPKSGDWRAYQRQEGTGTWTRGERPRKERGRGCCDVARSPRSRKLQGGILPGSLQRERVRPCGRRSGAFGLRNCGNVTSHVKPPVCGAVPSSPSTRGRGVALPAPGTRGQEMGPAPPPPPVSFQSPFPGRPGKQVHLWGLVGVYFGVPGRGWPCPSSGVWMAAAT